MTNANFDKALKAMTDLTEVEPNALEMLYSYNMKGAEEYERE